MNEDEMMEIIRKSRWNKPLKKKNIEGLQLIIANPEPCVCKVFQKYFDDLPNVKIVQSYFAAVSQYDCMVSAGNSFGLMDAGVDKAIVKFFGRALMERIQTHILEEYLGEQPVGTCFLVDTNHRIHPFVAHTPTMRAPMNIARTDNVYLAMWATLLEIRRHNRKAEKKIERIVFPCLGTGTGGVSLEESALQMSLAYKHFLNPPRFINGTLAQERHERVWYGGDWGFKQPRTSR